MRPSSSVALVEVQEIAHGEVVRREARGRRDGDVGVRVPRDEQVGAPVCVHVADRGSRVPACCGQPGLSRALGERPVALVPQERVVSVRGDVVARGGHVQVGVAVEVEVRRDASVPPQRQRGTRAAADVLERPVDVPEECRPGWAAALVPGGELGVRVGVDDEEVEPAVCVVVEPAEAAAHHRRRVVRHAEPECAVAEAQAHRRRDVRQRRAVERASDAGRPGALTSSGPPSERTMR